MRRSTNTEQEAIRNFCIIAHVDHGKSTLADRFLELTHTVEPRQMKPQYLDQLDLERERGITIKMAPVRMVYHPDRGMTRTETRNDAENELLYKDITYKIRGAVFEVRKYLGLGHKENVYHNALVQEFNKKGLQFETEKSISIFYNGKKVGNYQPDFIIENKIIIELKALPEIGRPQIEQLWSYLKGSDYKLALLVNFGSKNLEIKRVVYDIARFPRPSASIPRGSAQVEYILNLIDTPGHVDFSYEVSRSLAAVEGAILLVDVSQGIQAQTLANLHLAQQQGLVIIGALNKIDLPQPPEKIEELRIELAHLLHQSPEDIFSISGKTGQGTEELLRAVVQKIPCPQGNRDAPLTALVFDSLYDAYKGVVAFVRIMDGTVLKNDRIQCMATGAQAVAIDVGFFKPLLVSCDALYAGEIGYIATGIKDPNVVRVGDTVTLADACAAASQSITPLPGYHEPQQVVFVSMYPAQTDDIDALADALGKLKLNDASLSFTRERQEMLGQGFRIGCLGTLHLEIIKERLFREYGLEPIITAPSVKYEAVLKNGTVRDIFTPSYLPTSDQLLSIREPWVHGEIITPSAYVGGVLNVIHARRGVSGNVSNISLENVLVQFDMPLADVILDFYDRLKSVSQGYASVSYEVTEWMQGNLVKLDILVHGEVVDAFSRIVPKEKARALGLAIIEKLKELLPPEVFSVPIQAAIGSEIIARVTLAASRKNVTGHLYGGDRTRKMKLWKKQQKGKKRRALYGVVDVPASIFFKVFQMTKNE